MRPVHVARLDKSRPVLALTREVVRPHMHTVRVAPITTRIRGLSTELPLEPANGLEERCVVACDHVTTISATALERQIGHLLDEQEAGLTEALLAALDLDR